MTRFEILFLSLSLSRLFESLTLGVCGTELAEVRVFGLVLWLYACAMAFGSLEGVRGLNASRDTQIFL